MKAAKKLCLIAMAIMTLFLNRAGAQTSEGNYKFAAGIRAGETSGLTFNVNTTASTGLEFIAGIWSDWVSLTALYEIRKEAFNAKGLNWYYGGGGHFSFATGTYYQEGRTYPRGDFSGIGLDAILGLEFKIPEVPFAVNFNLKPLFEINTVGDLYFAIDPGIGLKFTF
jgi:hypothetical protein